MTSVTFAHILIEKVHSLSALKFELTLCPRTLDTCCQVCLKGTGQVRLSIILDTLVFLPLQISASSIYFDSLAYFTHHRNHTIDYEELEKKAVSFHPKLIIAGASAHPRKLDYGQFRKIATKVGAILMADMVID